MTARSACSGEPTEDGWARPASNFDSGKAFSQFPSNLITSEPSSPLSLILPLHPLKTKTKPKNFDRVVVRDFSGTQSSTLAILISHTPSWVTLLVAGGLRPGAQPNAERVQRGPEVDPAKQKKKGLLFRGLQPNRSLIFPSQCPGRHSSIPLQRGRKEPAHRCQRQTRLRSSADKSSPQPGPEQSQQA